MNKLSVGEAYKYAGRTLREHAGLLFGTSFFIVLVGFISDIVTNYYRDKLLLAVVLHIVFFILITWLTLGGTRILLNLHDGQSANFNQLFSIKAKLVWVYIGAAILYGLATLGGLILLIVPGIIILVKYSLYPFFIVDEGVGVKTSLKRSGEVLQKSNKGRVLWLMISSGLITAIIPILVGVIILISDPSILSKENPPLIIIVVSYIWQVLIIPYVALAFTYAYRWLVENHVNKATEIVNPA